MAVVERIADKIINDHHMLIEAVLCSCFRTPKSDCSICADLCPVGAIRISDKGAEITEGCIDCGVCISACPNGVFRSKERDDSKIILEIESKVRGWESGVFRISCERGNTVADLILPCLSRLTEVLLIEPMRMGASRIEILQPSCEKCPSVKASPHLDRILKQTLYLYEMVGIGKDSILVRSSEFGDQKNSELKTQNSELKALSRRELLGAIGTKAIEVAAASIPDLELKTEEKEEIFRETIKQRPENIKRSLLLESIRDIESRVNDYEVQNPKSKIQNNKVDVPSSDSIIAELEVDSKCTACGVCATLCPTGAITQRWTEDRFYLGFRPDLCTNCQVCVKTCMHGAIKIKEKVSLNLLLEQIEVKLFESEKKTCPVCQMVFIPTPKSLRLSGDPVGGKTGICPLCIDKHNKQMAAIQDLFKKGGISERV